MATPPQAIRGRLRCALHEITRRRRGGEAHATSAQRGAGAGQTFILMMMFHFHLTVDGQGFRCSEVLTSDPQMQQLDN